MEDAPRLAVPVADEDHVRGPEDAPVTLVEYGDFECPLCGNAYPVVKELERRYPAQLRVVFRSFPLRRHRRAQAAAEAAEFAADRGAFWAMHDRLYEHQDALEHDDLLAHAVAIGLDAKELDEALRAQTYRVLVEEVKEGGEDSGISQMPAIFLNGAAFEDEPTLENLAGAVEWLIEQGL
ncbi:MAG TPA: thioredoxin domain-containing protein [Candidatus Elarobacter sp.]